MSKNRTLHFNEVFVNIVKHRFGGEDSILRPLRAPGSKRPDLEHLYPDEQINYVFNEKLAYISGVLQQILVYNKREHVQEEDWTYSIPTEELRNGLGRRVEIISGKKEQIDIYPYILKEFFEITHSGNNLTGKTDKLKLKPEYRGFVSSLKELTIYNEADIPKKGLDKQTGLKISQYGEKKELNPYVIINKNSIIGAIEALWLHKTRKEKKLLTISDLTFLREIIGDTKFHTEPQKRIEEIEIELDLIDRFIAGNKKLIEGNFTIPSHYTHNTQNEEEGGKSGRLYNKTGLSGSLNIQQAKRPIRDILLSGLGLYDVDINNCHISLLNQYYKMIFGEEHKELNTFCSSYGDTRRQISSESDVRYDLVKQAILSLVYGGTYPTNAQIQSLRKELTIVREFEKIYGEGTERTKKELTNLFNSPTMRKIGDTIKEVIEKIYTENKKQGGRIFGRIYDKKGVATNEYENPAGYISKKDDNAHLLSHTLFGMEVLCLHHIIRTEHKDDLISLHHDGWVVRLGNRTREGYTETTTYQLKTKTDEMMKEWVDRRGIKLKLSGENRGWGFDLRLKVEGLDTKDKIYDTYRDMTQLLELETQNSLNKLPPQNRQ